MRKPGRKAVHKVGPAALAYYRHFRFHDVLASPGCSEVAIRAMKNKDDEVNICESTKN